MDIDGYVLGMTMNVTIINRDMKSLLKVLACVPIVLLFFKTCIYQKMTYMNESEQQWATNRNIGEIMVLKSENGDMASAVINDVTTYNSLNPINLNYNFREENLAMLRVGYTVFEKSDSLQGWVVVRKKNNDGSLEVSAALGNRVTIGSLSLDKISSADGDCLYFNSKNTEIDKYDKCPNPVASFVWSKSQGLMEFTLHDGTVYKRVDK